MAGHHHSNTDATDFVEPFDFEADDAWKVERARKRLAKMSPDDRIAFLDKCSSAEALAMLGLDDR